MKRLRIITVRKKKAIEYVSSESFRNKLLGLIVNPYEQLELHYNYSNNHFSLPETSKLVSYLALRTLSIYIQDLPRLVPRITQIQHLELQFERGDLKHHLPQLFDLRNLSLIDYPYLSLSQIQLNQQLDLRNLRYLKLVSCPSLCDVSCLDHIYELLLISCEALVDISCLNHNKIIVIDSCPVVDYSQSFRFSRNITIIVSYSVHNGNVAAIKSINLDNLVAVKSLRTSFNQRINFIDQLSFTERFPTSLRCLTLKGLRSRFSIPPFHSLREIIISECQEVSLQNLEKIEHVKIDRCHGIMDWSPIQRNKNIEISFCNGFLSGKQFNNVKKLSLICAFLNDMEDLNNITHLKIEFTGYESSTRMKKLFSSAFNLQEIEVEISYPDVSLLYLFKEIPRHKRISMNLFKKSNRDNNRNLEAFRRLVVMEFGQLYDVESKPPNKLILLKKEQKKRDEGSLFSSWSIASIIDYFKQR